MMRKAYAKINLSINIVGKRADGYHLLDMIVLPIDLHDELTIEIADKTTFECNVELPFDNGNIIYRAIELLRSAYGFKEQFNIVLNKNIPLEAGLAGGSTNAAATLHIINELLKFNLSNDELAKYAIKLGADVPFCLYSQCARVQGIGEIVQPFTLNKGYDYLLIKPAKGICTKTAFELVDSNPQIHPDIVKIQQALINHEPIDNYLGNSIQTSAIAMVNEIEDIINLSKSYGFKNALMTGSGSTCFVITETNEDTSELEQIARKKYPFVHKGHILIK